MTTINDYLIPELKGVIKAEIYDELESTNALMRRRAAEGAGEGLVITANRQTAGRGRMGRSFFSPDGTGVYMSLLLRPDLKPESSVLITTAAAVAVCRALDSLGARGSAIKWVNDVFFNGKKVCGILTEAGFSGKNGCVDYAVLGVGINLFPPKDGFPEDIKNIAGAVFNSEECGKREKFIAFFLNEFYSFYENLEKKPHCREYAERNFAVGKKVDVFSGGSVKKAEVTGIDDDCCLLVRYENGETGKLNSGEISIRLS